MTNIRNWCTVGRDKLLLKGKEIISRDREIARNIKRRCAMKLWRWLMDKLKRILGLSKPAQVIPETPAEKPEAKRRRRPFRLLRVPHYGPDMPKRQPCKKCGARGKRTGKEVPSSSSPLLGAIYRCRTHGTWFIPHPSMRGRVS